jgi:hypothetical protein
MYLPVPCLCSPWGERFRRARCRRFLVVPLCTPLILIEKKYKRDSGWRGASIVRAYLYELGAERVGTGVQTLEVAAAQRLFVSPLRRAWWGTGLRKGYTLDGGCPVTKCKKSLRHRPGGPPRRGRLAGDARQLGPPTTVKNKRFFPTAPGMNGSRPRVGGIEVGFFARVPPPHRD